MIEVSIITFLVAAGIALVLENVPGAAHAWEKTPYKSLIVFVAFLVLPVVFITAQCFGYDLHVGATCEDGFSVQLLIDALVIGLTAYCGSQMGYAASRTSGTSLRRNLAWDKVEVKYASTGESISSSGNFFYRVVDGTIEQRLTDLENDLENDGVG